MRLVYAADLHGDTDSYRSLFDLAVTTDARAAIVGGDLLGLRDRCQFVVVASHSSATLGVH